MKLLCKAMRAQPYELGGFASPSPMKAPPLGYASSVEGLSRSPAAAAAISSGSPRGMGTGVGYGSGAAYGGSTASVGASNGSPHRHRPNSNSAALNALLGDLIALDTVPIRQAEDRQIVEEHYLEEMRRAAAEADRADADCDDARHRIKQLKATLGGARHKRDSTAAIVSDYKSRLEGINKAVEEDRHAIVALTDAKTSAARAAKAAESDRARLVRERLGAAAAAVAASASGIGGLASAADDDSIAADPSNSNTTATAAGLVGASLEALRYEVECEERRVLALRTRHSDAHALAKAISTDVAMLRSRLQATERRRAELETARLQLAAIEANNGYTDAAAAFAEHKTLAEKAEWQRKEIAATRVEGQSMALHLIDGAKTRAEAMNTERRRLIAQYKAKYGSSSADVASNSSPARDGISTNGGGGGALSVASEATLNDLIAVNSTRRAELISLIVSSSAEKEALEQYIGVLSEKCGNLLQQLRAAEERRQATSAVAVVAGMGIGGSPAPQGRAASPAGHVHLLSQSPIPKSAASAAPHVANNASKYNGLNHTALDFGLSASPAARRF